MGNFTILSLQTFGTNCSISNIPTSNGSNVVVYCKEILSSELPEDLTEISESSVACIIAYCIVFVIAATGNLMVFSTLLRKYRRSQSRITLLLLNLTLADLIVCCTLIPTEVFWRLTVQWMGGNLLCKLTQFLCAFGLYLSSLILICVSIDRFLAIMYPMTMLKVAVYTRVKVMLAVAWISAFVISTPQLIFFSVEAHPDYPSFKQCVTNDFLNNSNGVKIYSIFSVVVLYFVPLFVVIFTYSSILCKLSRKSNDGSFGIYYNVRQYVHNGCNNGMNHQIQNGVISIRNYQLRCTNNAESNLTKARKRTLMMTIVMVSAFVVCWSPYAFMTLWYMIDWKGAAEVDYRLQDALFLMAVANSCINPLIYGGFNYNRGAPSLDRPSVYC